MKFIRREILQDQVGKKKGAKSSPPGGRFTISFGHETHQINQVYRRTQPAGDSELIIFFIIRLFVTDFLQLRPEQRRMERREGGGFRHEIRHQQVRPYGF